MSDSLSVRHGRVTLIIDLPEPVMSRAVFDALQALQQPFLKLAEVLDDKDQR